MNQTTLDKLIAVITATANEPAVSYEEDFMVDDYAGGNIDDAFSLGQSEGEILFARKLLDILEA